MDTPTTANDFHTPARVRYYASKHALTPSQELNAIQLYYDKDTPPHLRPTIRTLAKRFKVSYYCMHQLLRDPRNVPDVS